MYQIRARRRSYAATMLLTLTVFGLTIGIFARAIEGMAEDLMRAPTEVRP